MQRALLLVLLLCIGFLSYTQDFAILEGDTNTLHITEFEPGVNDYIVHSHVVNNGAEELNLKWVRTEIDFPEGWESAICDINLCYLNWVDSVDFNLEPAVEGRMDAHFYPNEIFGTGIIHLLIKNLNNPSENIEGVYIFQAEKLTSNGTVEADFSSLKVFPNPTSQFFMLNNPGSAKKIEVINVVGRKVKSFDVIRGSQYDISELQDGYYIIKMTDARGKMLRSVRLSKRS